MENSNPENPKTEETLDPADWDQVRQIGYQMIDDMIGNMKSVRERPVWQSVPADVRETLDEPIPWEGLPLADVYDSFRKNILPYPTGNAHPRFFGWVMGNGSITGALADFLASTMNCHVAGYDQSATLIENRVLDWLTQLMGYPAESTGLLVSGGSMANINAVLVARNSIAGLNIREEGICNDAVPPLTIYGSEETHSWILKACEVMGLGRKAFRKVPVASDFRIDVAECQRIMRDDIRNGCRPICIVGNVGTVNTGAIDDLDSLRKIADEFETWLHVDGAFGSMAAWGQRSNHLVQAQSQSDSLAFDLHKWGYMPYEAACVLIRDPDSQTATFGYAPSYLTSSDRGISVDVTRFADRGLQLTRGFRALKVWMSMKEQGVNRIGRIIDQNVEQARLLATVVAENLALELLAPVSLNIVCFRFVSDEWTDERLDEINREILIRIQESGFAVPSQTVIHGKFAIRVCITNHRTQTEDLVELAKVVERHGKDILTETQSTGD